MPKSAALLLISVLAGLGAGCADAPSAPESFSPVNAAAASQNSIFVTNTAQLLAALSSPNTSIDVVMAPGEYELSSTLVVPDGTTLVGGGTMQFDPSGLPSGFVPSTRTVLKAASTLTGDMVLLGDRSALSRIVIEDAQRSGGSVVVASSRGAGDVVRTALDECEIISPNPDGIAPQGPSGTALLLINRNQNFGAAPAPDVGAEIALRMSRSIVRAPAGGVGIFAINFAAGASLELTLTQNVVAAGLRLVAGVSRPDAVDGASVLMDSRRNLYTADLGGLSTHFGWQVYGASNVPIAALAIQPVTNNSTRVHSVDDRVEGFETAIWARGGARVSPGSPEVSFNSANLELYGTQLQSDNTDLDLVGAGSIVEGAWPDAGNTLRVLARAVTGSGVRENLYADALGPGVTEFGAGNRLELVGNLQAFVRTNSEIMPPPPAQFFSPHN